MKHSKRLPVDIIQHKRRVMRYGELVRVSGFRTTQERLAAMRDYCAEHQIDRTELIEAAVDEYMEKVKK